jgi:hypothetical protein
MTGLWIMIGTAFWMSLISGSRAVAQSTSPLPESPNPIGYPTVKAAIEDLRAKPGILWSIGNGWTIADDEAAHVLWSFPPPTEPSYPSAVKRAIVKKPQGIGIQTSILCESNKTACDDLVREYQQLDQQARQQYQRSHSH